MITIEDAGLCVSLAETVVKMTVEVKVKAEVNNDQ
jgi:hypothetical protein